MSDQQPTIIYGCVSYTPDGETNYGYFADRADAEDAVAKEMSRREEDAYETFHDDPKELEYQLDFLRNWDVPQVVEIQVVQSSKKSQ